MRRAPMLAVVTLACGLTAPSLARAADEAAWGTASDIGQASLVALAVGMTAVDRDGQGARQLALSLGVTEAATYGLKHAFPEERPNGRNDRSFPSGHTSVSFASAAYIQQRYGWRVGLPATIAAGLVGLARVEAREHHWYDVVAGAALGEATAIVFTHARERGVAVLPWGDRSGAGVSIAARF